MPLPTGGDWPPKPHGIAFQMQDLWNAWYVGDAELLSSSYANADPYGSGGMTEEHSFEPKRNAQQGAGVIQRVARFFWSRPSTTGQRKPRLHVPLAADIATASADLLFSEPPQFKLDTGEAEAAPSGPADGPIVVKAKTPAEQRIDDILNDDDFHAELVEAGEVVAALGGGWLRLVWDKEIADRVMVDAVAADSAWGEWRWGKLVAVTFFTEYSSGQGEREVIRHLERHEPGVILHGLYRGDAKKLGVQIPLSENPDTRELLGDAAAAGAIEVVVDTGVKSLTAAYVANMRPQRRWRKVEALANLGRSDYDGVEQLFDALDETYTSWMRDVRLAKSRILVPEFMLQNLGKGAGAAWDEDQEVYSLLKMAPTDAAQSQITAQQFKIRVQEHSDTAGALIDQILDAAGYSPSTFGRGGEGMATATEVVSRERKSSRTRDKKCRYWSQAMEPLLSTWLEVDGIVFGGAAKGQVEVEWADESQAEPLQLAQTAQALRVAEAASTKTLVAMVNPDWDEAKIQAETEAIMAESGRSVPEPLPFA